MDIELIVLGDTIPAIVLIKGGYGLVLRGHYKDGGFYWGPYCTCGCNYHSMPRDGLRRVAEERAIILLTEFDHDKSIGIFGKEVFSRREITTLFPSIFPARPEDDE